MRAIGQRRLEQPDGFVVETFRAGHADDHMHRHIDSRGEAVAQTFATVGMACDFQTAPVRFIDNRLILFERQRRNVDHFSIGRECARAIRLRIASAFVIFGLVNLDPVGAVMRVLADRRAREPG